MAQHIRKRPSTRRMICSMAFTSGLIFTGITAAATTAQAEERKTVSSPCPAKIAVLGGTYLNDTMMKSGLLGKSFTVDTAAGTSSPIYCGKSGKIAFYYIHGHGEGKPAEAWAALYALGVKDAIGGATAGGINDAYKVNDFIIPDDFIDFNINRPRSLPQGIFPEGQIILPRYTPAIDTQIASILEEETAKKLAATPALSGNKVIKGGVLVQAAGGRFETAAEIRMFKMLGSDLVTMNVATEMAYARIVGINYASLVIISNPAEGLGEWEFSSLGDVYKVVNPASLDIVLATLPRIAAIGDTVPRVGDKLRIHPEMTSGN